MMRATFLRSCQMDPGAYPLAKPVANTFMLRSMLSQSFSPSTSLNAVDRRGFGNAFAAAAATIVAPQITNAAVGESPKFSVFGLLGDGTSYSEGAAYGSDQVSEANTMFIFSNCCSYHVQEAPQLTLPVLCTHSIFVFLVFEDVLSLFRLRKSLDGNFRQD